MIQIALKFTETKRHTTSVSYRPQWRQ